MLIQVECYAGHRGEETPRRIRVESKTLDVIEILDRWLAPDHRYFKVRLESGQTWIIRHDVTTGLWEATS